MPTNFSIYPSYERASNVNNSIVNKLDTILDIIDTSSNPRQRPLVFYSLTSTGPMKLIPTPSSERYKMYELHIPRKSMMASTPKRVHYFDSDRITWNLMGTGYSLLDEFIQDFDTNGPNFDIDNVGGYVPNTQDTTRKQTSITVLTINNQKTSLLNFHIHNITKSEDKYIISVQHDTETRVYHLNNKNHPVFSVDNRHYHTSPTENVSQELPVNTEESQLWSLEIYY